MRARSRTMEHGSLDDCRALVEPPCAALETGRGKGFERLYEARQGRLHYARADLPDPRIEGGSLLYYLTEASGPRAGLWIA
jgi:hypothetical protein